MIVVVEIDNTNKKDTTIIIVVIIDEDIAVSFVKLMNVCFTIINKLFFLIKTIDVKKITVEAVAELIN